MGIQIRRMLHNVIFEAIGTYVYRTVTHSQNSQNLVEQNLCPSQNAEEANTSHLGFSLFGAPF